MAIPNKQIGWSNESNLIWEISRQLEQLIGVAYAAGIKPYKVYSALLTQTGTSASINQTSGTFDIGVTYLIDVYNAGDDFSNIGGPSAGLPGQWDGYSFVATGTTPLVYTNSSSIDHNTGAPVVTVLENTIGNIWFSYIGLGVYAINSSNLFINNKTYLNNKSVIADDTSSLFWSLYDGVSEILIGNTVNGSADNSLITNHPIEIRVYN